MENILIGVVVFLLLLFVWNRLRVTQVDDEVIRAAEQAEREHVEQNR